jgi:hypothetical protein
VLLRAGRARSQLDADPMLSAVAQGRCRPRHPGDLTGTVRV